MLFFTLTEEIFPHLTFANFFFGHFAGINFRELDFNKDFASINFHQLSSTKDFAGIDFRESAPYKDFTEVNFAFSLWSIFSTTLVYGYLFYLKQVEHDVDPLQKRTDGQTNKANYIEPALSPLLIPKLLYLAPDT